MGWGADLIPGGNDGLLLIGMPLLRPYAWIAAAAMAAAILVLLTISRRSHSGIAAG
jgi:toxin CptA